MIKTDDKRVICHFDGTGDIRVGVSGNSVGKMEAVWFSQNVPHAIGENIGNHFGQTFDEAGIYPKVMLWFAKPESVQVVIDYLEKVKQDISNKEATCNTKTD